MPLDGLDPLIQRGQIGLEGVVPDDPHGVFLRDQFLERGGAEADLITNGGLKPRVPISGGSGSVGLGSGSSGRSMSMGGLTVGTLGWVNRDLIASTL